MKWMMKSTVISNINEHDIVKISQTYCYPDDIFAQNEVIKKSIAIRVTLQVPIGAIARHEYSQ